MSAARPITFTSELDALQRSTCPNCDNETLRTFYRLDSVPVHSVLLLRSEWDATTFPTGDIELAYCRECTFVTNVRFSGDLQNYSSDYEETQAYSDTFNAFHRRLASDLIEEFDLHGKTVLEIGCGKGDFLHLLCQMGDNRGIGFDPAYVPERDQHAGSDRTEFVRAFYGEGEGHYDADLYVCKMTLEHIHGTARFVGAVRTAIGERTEARLFFQVPDAERVFRDIAFWDVYYEHCSYFTRSSLTRLFEDQGFDVERVWTDYDDQYLMLTARPRIQPLSIATAGAPQNDAEALVGRFGRLASERIARWRAFLQAAAEQNRPVVLWGGGSKAVAFLTSVGAGPEVAGAVDINPNKHRTFLAGTGHCILPPDDLIALDPAAVIVMNPIYTEEIGASLSEMGLAPLLVPVDGVPPDHP